MNPGNIKLPNYNGADLISGLAGLAVTYGLKINILQAWVIWNACNVKNKMISVERIIQFSCIPSEALSVLKDLSPEPK